MGYVEEEFEGLGEGHEVHGRNVVEGQAPRGFRVALCVAGEGGVYGFIEVLVIDEGVEVHIGVVG